MNSRTRFGWAYALGWVVLLVALVANPAARLLFVLGLFEANVLDENFRSMDRALTARVVSAPAQPSPLVADPQPLPESYQWGGQTKSIEAFLEHVHTSGLVVLRGDRVLVERYARGDQPTSRHIAWSVSKSFLSALFGMAVNEGHIRNLDEPVDAYVPALRDSGYAGVRIKDVLQMSSGIRFNEDYGDFDADINVMGRFFAINLPLVDFIRGLKNGRAPGTVNHYVSMDTQVLGMVLVAATGRTLTDYTQEKLWTPLGMEADATWLIDGAGMEAAFGGLNATVRDWARFGRLYLNQGRVGDRALVPAAWVKASVTPDAPHLLPSAELGPQGHLGYGYQWWIPPGTEGDFLAIGIYGQAIYVSPSTGIVIARSANYPAYNDDGGAMELESVAVFRAIAHGLR